MTLGICCTKLFTVEYNPREDGDIDEFVNDYLINEGYNPDLLDDIEFSEINL